MSTYITLIIPAYGEAENLPNLLPGIQEALDALASPVSASILVVLPTHSTKEESTLVRNLGATPIVRGPTDSFGDAVRTGIAAVDERSDYTIFMDADGSHDPATVARLMTADSIAHVVVASRYVAGGGTDNPWHLRVMSRALNRAYSIALGINCHDISTSFKRYRSKDLEGLELRGKDFDIVEEILFKVKVAHGDDFRIVEIPDHFLARQYGVTKRQLGPFILSYIVSLLRLRLQTRDRTQ